MMINPGASSNPKQQSIRRRFTYRFLRTLKQVNSRRHITAAGRSRSSRRRRSLEIKHAANMCMAATVGGTRAWSRAVLSKIRRRRRGLETTTIRRRRSCGVKNEISSWCWTEELREIVPGGEELDASSLLDETAHYIKCLTTQVQVMTDILHLCAN